MSRTTSPRLFTPGPLTTCDAVRAAMTTDYGSRDEAFIKVIAECRSTLLSLAGTSQEAGYEAILMQGSGTFAIESMLGSVVGSDATLLVLVNGAYGRRIHAIAERLGITCSMLECAEHEVPDPSLVEAAIGEGVTHLAAVHCETTTGILNPIEAYADLAARAGVVFMVDAMSSFGGYEIDIAKLPATYLVASSNKCLEGTPGFGFIIAQRSHLQTTQGIARSVSLDLLAQWEGLERTGQFRFTPPTHVLLAFHKALELLAKEGGISARALRYQARNAQVISGMKALGYEPYIDAALRSHIITTFRYPEEEFDFEAFYTALAEHGLVIYPGKLTEVDCFRIGNIGALTEADVAELLSVVGELTPTRT